MKKRKLFTIILLTVLTSGNAYSQTKTKQITVEDLWKYWSFYAPSVNGIRSMNDGEHYTKQERGGNIVKINYKSGDQVAVIFDASKNKIRPEDYQFNADETKLLFYTNSQRIYRRSFTADYYFYDMKSEKLSQVSENGAQQIAAFSPSADKISFVRKNNLFIKDLKSDKETQITTDGKFNKIINGIPDWVYEEEFEFNKAYDWSPDGKKIAYIKFNEEKVPLFGIQWFAGQSPKLKENVLYPANHTFKYPKAGERNSEISIHIYDLETGKTIKVDIGNEKDIYIPRLRWTADKDKLSIFRLNRLQNKLELLYANPTSGKTKVILTEENKKYVDETDFDNLTFLKGGKSFVMTSERSGYRHLYLYNTNGQLISTLTSGNWDVTDFLGYDDKKEIFYFQAAKKSAVQREVYSVDKKGKKIKQLSENQGTNTAEFSSNFKYFINFYSSTKVPTKVTLHKTKSGKLIRVLRENEALAKKIEEYGGQNKEFFTFKTSEGIELNAWKILPPNFDPKKKYPAIITQYSGPGSQQALDEWDFGWDNLLAQKGIIMVCVDPRGTGARGEDFRKKTYLELGKYETIDLIETGKYLASLPYINKEKLGIWGWSFGGYTTSLCMTKGKGLFAAGIAVAPVTNWRYYDNIYTERFMRTPQENASGYDQNSPINFADGLQGKFLIVHGSADDNVHLQNTAEFTEALVQANKQFEQFIYTNRNHSIYGGNTRIHLFTMMLKFWKKNLLSKN